MSSLAVATHAGSRIHGVRVSNVLYRTVFYLLKNLCPWRQFSPRFLFPFCDCKFIRLVIVICLAFCDFGLPFLRLKIVICLRGCDWFASHHEIVICLALYDGDSHVDWITTLRNGDLLLLRDAIVIHLLLCNADFLG